MPRAITLLSLITAGGLALAGCGASSDGTSAAGSSSSPTTGGAPAASAPTTGTATAGCPDPTKVGGMLGANLEKPTVFDAAIGVTCQYTGRWASDNKSAFVTVTIQNAETDAAWAKYRQDALGIGKNIKDIPNLGDDAFSMETESFGIINNVSVRKGTRFVFVASRATIDQEISLARTLL
jgi:hypothetical protein